MINPFKNYIQIGHIQRTHGIKGVLVIQLLYKIQKLETIAIDLDGAIIPFQVKDYDIIDSVAHVSLEGIDLVSDAEPFRGRQVLAKADIIPDEEKIYQKIIGYTLIDINNGCIGRIKSLETISIQKIIFIENGIDEILVPYNKEFIKSIDDEKKVVYTNLPYKGTVNKKG